MICKISIFTRKISMIDIAYRVFFFSYGFHINFITNMKLLLQTTRVISFNFESKIINRISI